MSHKGSLRLMAISFASLIVCCICVVELGRLCLTQRQLAASRPLPQWFHFGPTNFKFDSLLGDAVFSRDAAIREQSIMRLIKQANPVHISQLELLAKLTEGEAKTQAIQALKRLSEA